MKVVINKCFGGFGLSDKAYEKLIEYGIPVVKFEELERGEDGKYIYRDYGKVIFDRELDSDRDEICLMGRYWNLWINKKTRSDELLVRVVEELGDAVNDIFSELKVVDIPDGIDWEIDEYDGLETIHEKHRSW